MKILVAMTHYGSKNTVHAKRLLAEYRAMPFEVDVVVLCEAPKALGDDVTERVGLPIDDPWSLPFAHKSVFVDNAERYDLFIYTEDDTLIREDNIRAFLAACAVLPDDLLPGFVRYELHPDGRKNYNDIHGPFHWIPGSIARSGDYVYATLSNAHSACYALTRGQLKRAIASGGFAVPLHSGRYDLACTASTDPYTQCGFRRVICLSHLERFEVHHLPNAYLDRMGLSGDSHDVVVDGLLDVLVERCSDRELFATEKAVDTPDWDKAYDEPLRLDVLQRLPPAATRVLSVGCGCGTTEAHLVERGVQVTAIPIDAVIGRLGARRGIRMLPPDFDAAFAMLGDETFDAIVLPDILQHLEAPVDILARLGRHLAPDGILVGTVPNLGRLRRLSGRLVARTHRWTRIGGQFAGTRLHMTSVGRTRRWLQQSGFHAVSLGFDKRLPSEGRGGLHSYLPAVVAASNIVFEARRVPVRPR